MKIWVARYLAQIQKYIDQLKIHKLLTSFFLQVTCMKDMYTNISKLCFSDAA